MALGKSRVLSWPESLGQLEGNPTMKDTTESLQMVAFRIMASKPGPWSGAWPHVEAMARCKSIDDNGAREAVTAFLESAKSWRGSDARNIKRQLRSML